MVSKKLVEDVKDSLYSIIWSIQNGEMSDIDTDWGSLAVSIGRLKIKGLTVPKKPEKAIVSNMLRCLEGIASGSLIKIVGQLEDSCKEVGSEDSFDPDALEDMQSKLSEFEELIFPFLKNLKEYNEK